ncbi:MAG: hypothetical protein M5U34_34850 [Chloroflexi bacterium]|nr:hypothetical protein [Chloroflexota bacterium]
MPRSGNMSGNRIDWLHLTDKRAPSRESMRRDALNHFWQRHQPIGVRGSPWKRERPLLF